MAAGWVAFPGWLQAWSARVPLTISWATLGAADLTAQRVAIQPPTALANGLADLVGPAGSVLDESFSAFVPPGVALLCIVALWPQRAERAALAPTVGERAVPLATPQSAR